MSSNAQNDLNPPPDYTPYGGTKPPTSQANSVLARFPSANSNDGQSGFVSDSAYLASNPRTTGVAKITLGGTATTGDTAFIEISCGIFKRRTAQSATLVVAGDTLATIAARLVDGINSGAQMQQFGITAELNVVSSNQVISLFWPGPISKFAVVQGYANVNTSTLALTGTATTNDVLSLAFAGKFPLSNVYTASLAFAGTVSTGDVNSLKFTHPALPSGSKTVTYTSAGGNALQDIAAGFATAIAADSDITGLGVVASAVGGVLYLNWGQAGKSLTYAYTVTRTATETFTANYTAGTAPSYLAPGVVGSYTATVGGTPQAGDILTATFRCGNFPNAISVFYVVQGGDTTTTIAAALTNAINAQAQLAEGSFAATSTGAVITVTWLSLLAGANVNIATSVFAPPTEQAVVINPITSQSVSYTVVAGNTLSNIATGLASAINANPALTALGISATASTSNVVVEYNGAMRPLALTFSNSGTTEIGTITTAAYVPTVTIAGTPAAGDTVDIHLVSGEFVDGATDVTYTVVAGDTVTTIAAALTALLNNNPDFEGGGYSATSSAGVISFTTEGEDPNPTLTTIVTGATTATVGNAGSNGTETFSVTQFVGGGGPIQITANFDNQNGAVCERFQIGQLLQKDYNSIKNLVASQAPVK